jgi:hypothetical protein
VKRCALFGALLVGLIPALASCGTTTVDQTIAARGDTTPTTTLPPVDPDATLVSLVGDLADSMRHLDEQVIDGDVDDATLARIEQLWLAAEPLARELDADVRFGLQKSVQLARTSVERHRPADASKGYKIVADLLARLS